MQEESDELGALISKLQLGDDEMSIKTYIQMEGEEIPELELTIDELVDVALGINHAQGFDLNVHLHSIDVDDIAPPTVKLSDAKRHASLLFNLLLYWFLPITKNGVLDQHWYLPITKNEDLDQHWFLPILKNEVLDQHN